MLKVRRSLTEILLEVTNEEISSVCREVWSRYRAKGTADNANRIKLIITKILFSRFSFIYCGISNNIYYNNSNNNININNNMMQVKTGLTDAIGPNHASALYIIPTTFTIKLEVFSIIFKIRLRFHVNFISNN